MIAAGALLIAGLLMLTACGNAHIQVQTQGYGDSYTQLGHD